MCRCTMGQKEYVSRPPSVHLIKRKEGGQGVTEQGRNADTPARKSVWSRHPLKGKGGHAQRYIEANRAFNRDRLQRYRTS